MHTFFSSLAWSSYNNIIVILCYNNENKKQKFLIVFKHSKLFLKQFSCLKFRKRDIEFEFIALDKLSIEIKIY